MMNVEERLIDFEIRLSRQDDVVDVLNNMVYQQQKKIDDLEKLCKALANRLGEVSVNLQQRGSAVDERPPHY
jgi:SlyX protein